MKNEEWKLQQCSHIQHHKTKQLRTLHKKSVIAKNKEARNTIFFYIMHFIYKKYNFFYKK